MVNKGHHKKTGNNRSSNKEDANSVGKELNGNSKVNGRMTNGITPTTKQNGNSTKSSNKKGANSENRHEQNGHNWQLNGNSGQRHMDQKIDRKRSSSSKCSENSSKSTYEDRTDIEYDEPNASPPPPVPSTSPPHDLNENSMTISEQNQSESNKNDDMNSGDVSEFQFHQRDKDRHSLRGRSSQQIDKLSQRADEQHRSNLTVNRSTIDDKNGTRRISERSLYSDTFQNKTFLELKQPPSTSNNMHLEDCHLSEANATMARSTIGAAHKQLPSSQHIRREDVPHTQASYNHNFNRVNGPNRATHFHSESQPAALETASQTNPAVTSTQSQTDALTSDGLLIFHSQSPWDRFETMNQIVRTMEAFETRFFATCFEAVARVQANKLRDTENRANSSESIIRLRERKGNYLESCNYLFSLLSLLFGNSRKEAAHYFEVLQVIFQQHYEEMSKLRTTEEKLDLVEKLGKLVSAAIYHPAFSIVHAEPMTFWRETLWKEREQLNLQIAQERQQKENAETRSGAQATTMRLTEEQKRRSTMIYSQTHNFEYIYSMKAAEGGFRGTTVPIEITWSDGAKSYVGKSKQELFNMHFRLIDEFGLENSDSGERVLPRIQEDGSDEEYLSYINKLSDMPARIILSPVIKEAFYASRQLSPDVNFASQRPAQQSYAFMEQPRISTFMPQQHYFNAPTNPMVTQSTSVQQTIPMFALHPPGQPIQHQMPSCHICAGSHDWAKCPEKICGSRVAPEGLRLRTRANDLEPSLANSDRTVTGPPLAPLSKSPLIEPTLSQPGFNKFVPLNFAGPSASEPTVGSIYPPSFVAMAMSHQTVIAPQIQLFSNGIMHNLQQLAQFSPQAALNLVNQAVVNLHQYIATLQQFTPPPPLMQQPSQIEMLNHQHGSQSTYASRPRDRGSMSYGGGPLRIYTDQHQTPRDRENETGNGQRWQQEARQGREFNSNPSVPSPNPTSQPADVEPSTNS
ncbi:unnamed protein product, partial [Mesorhabditis belari]|uniref:SMAUG/ZCCHC2-like PHAT domain-containing protein n=1 Tax=Mesorhabditis belari TaxID=2138241 RepID=A0AAF3J9R9_9BILA